MTPAQVKFAWFHRAQKCAFLAFYAKFESVPLKNFFRKISYLCKNQFSFDQCYSRISQVCKSAVIGQLFKFNFLFFSKKVRFFSHWFRFPGWRRFSYLNNCIKILSSHFLKKIIKIFKFYISDHSNLYKREKDCKIQKKFLKNVREISEKIKKKKFKKNFFVKSALSLWSLTAQRWVLKFRE